MFSVNKPHNDRWFIACVFPWQRVANLNGVTVQLNQLACKKAATCCSVELASISPGSTPLSAATTRAYDRGLIWSPVTITSFILEYCSKSATLLWSYAILFSFSAFWVCKAFTFSTRSRILFCCNLTAEISSVRRSSNFLISSNSSVCCFFVFFWSHREHLKVTLKDHW